MSTTALCAFPDEYDEHKREVLPDSVGEQLPFPPVSSSSLFYPLLSDALYDPFLASCDEVCDDATEETDPSLPVLSVVPHASSPSPSSSTSLAFSSSLSLGMDVESKHRREHEMQVEWMNRCVLRHRDRVGVETAWRIQCQVLCRHEMSESEAMLWYDASLKYALIRMRCDIPVELMTWLVVHELHELLLWEMDESFTHLFYAHPLDQLAMHHEHDYHDAKNRLVELLTYRHLGYQRPTHMLFLSAPTPRLPLPSMQKEREQLV